MTWRTSSYSPNGGGNCVETQMTLWRKSSYSPDAGGNCVEIGPTLDHISIRDSKDRRGPVLTTSISEWAGFAHDLRTGLLDR